MVVTSSSIIVFVFDDFQTTNDRSNHAPYDDVTKRTKGESGLLFDTHMSHKHLMDSVNCTPGGEACKPTKRRGMIKASERASGTTTVPAAFLPVSHTCRSGVQCMSV